jgi:hypothetical protein
MSKTVRVTGNTKARKEVLKKDGWRWSPENQNWWQNVSDTHAAWLLDPATQAETIKKFDWKYVGCQIAIGSEVIWTSKTYCEAVAVESEVESTLDGRLIPGSDPSDRY